VIITRQFTAAILTFAMLAGCVDTVEQGQADDIEPSSELASIILQSDGVSQGEDMHFPYGTEKTKVIAMLERFGPAYQNANDECGVGPMVQIYARAIGLTLNFQEDRLVGWYFDGDGKMARTAQNITVGSPRVELEKAMTVEMEPESTLGIEFFARLGETGYIGGFLSDESKNAVVESLYSGATCFFR